MFVSSTDYPSFRSSPSNSFKKSEHFQHLLQNKKSLQNLEKKIINIDHSSDQLHHFLDLDKNDEKMEETHNYSTHEKHNDKNKILYKQGVNITRTFFKYLDMEKNKTESSLFHFPPIIREAISKEANFVTFTEIDENNSKFFSEKSAMKKKLQKGKKGVTEELTYNNEQWRMLNEESRQVELSKFKSLIQEIKVKEAKLEKLAGIKNYPSPNLIANGKNPQFFNQMSARNLILKKNEENMNTNNKNAKLKKRNSHAYNIESLVYFYHFEYCGWRPEIRELSTMVLFDKKIFVYSGIGRNVMEDVVVGDLSNLTWSKSQTTGDVPQYGRYGHSAVVYNRKMYVFGGEKKYNSHLKQHECLNDVKSLNFDNMQWKFIRTIGDPIDPRRNHAAALAGKYMIVHGGISPKDQYLNDFWVFDIVGSKWSMAPVKGANKAGIAFHTCCSVFLPERTKIIINKPLESFEDLSKKTISYEGIYFFGGKTLSSFSNELSILLIDRNPMQLIKPDIMGQPPIPRCGHTIIYNEYQNIVIIYGGRNDYEKQFFSDIHILKLNMLTWVAVKPFGTIKSPRASHCACSYNSRMIVFGGLNLEGLVGSEILTIELDQAQTRKLQGLDPLKTSLEEEEAKLITEGSNEKKDLKKDQLDIFKMENEKDLKKKKKIQMMVENLKFQNFKSFLPIPTVRFGNKGFSNAEYIYSPNNSMNKSILKKANRSTSRKSLNSSANRSQNIESFSLLQ